ncbi:MAG: hypothetical protein ABSD29_09240 [Verrucomicrobiota bacterium]|jgi:hypothetical protein
MAVDRRNPNPAERGLWLPVLLFVLVLGTLLPCLRNGFVNLDDRSYASQSPNMRRRLMWAKTQGAEKWGGKDRLELESGR